MKSRLNESTLFLLATFGLVAGMLLLLGKAPLYLEEPRRALIALEMAYSGNYWALTQFGEWYYNKPPMFTWVLLLFAKLGGGFQEFVLRLPTVLSTLAVATLLFFAGRRWVNAYFGSVAGLLFLTFSSFLFYFSTLAEIDLFYTLVTFTGILAIYYFGEKGQYTALFLAVYASCAVGVLSKGLPSLAFTAISLLVYFLDKKQFLRLVSWPHTIGILLLAAVIGGYVWQYAQFNNPMYLLENLFEESNDRTAAAYSVLDFLTHLLTFPFDFLKDLLPGGLLLVFLFRRDWIAILLNRHPFIRFCTWMLLANIVVYWISPGTRLRYVYPLFPFAACILSWLWVQRAEAPIWAERFFSRMVTVLCVLFAIGLLALPFIPALQFLSYSWWVALPGAVLFLGLIRYQVQNKPHTLAVLFLALALARIAFDLTILPQRAAQSEARDNKWLAARIYQLTGNAPVYLYGEEKVISFNSIFYLNRLRVQPVQLQDQLQRGQYYILPKRLIVPQDSILLETVYRDTAKVLILKK